MAAESGDVEAEDTAIDDIVVLVGETTEEFLAGAIAADGEAGVVVSAVLEV